MYTDLVMQMSETERGETSDFFTTAIRRDRWDYPPHLKWCSATLQAPHIRLTTLARDSANTFIAS
jgi:hypothetical protein